MQFELLLSCMHQTDFSLVERSHITCPVLLVNQAEREEYQEQGHARMLTTMDRGTSKSRNLALKNARGEICLFADDDEWFVADLESKILAAYASLPEADVIIFDLRTVKKFGTQTKELKRLDALRVGTVRVSFRRRSIVGKVAFDELLGPGTPTKSTEDVKFILDCFDAGLRVFFYPLEIAALLPSESTWFSGYTAEYFFNRGRITRYILGLPMAVVYAVYFLVRKHRLYKQTISGWSATCNLFKGLATRDLEKEV